MTIEHKCGLTTPLIDGLALPVNPSEAANKEYVDSFVFGNDAFFVQDLTVSTQTTTTYQTKLSGNFPSNLPNTAQYLVMTNYQWNLDSTGRDFNSRLRINNVEIFQHRQEPKDAAGNFGSTGTDQRYCFTNVRILQGTQLSGDPFILEWRTQTNNIEASIWNASIVMWRIL